jgi:hypothetical protein
MLRSFKGVPTCTHGHAHRHVGRCCCRLLLLLHLLLSLQMVNTLAEILAASGGIGNFNLYMAAGGTSEWTGLCCWGFSDRGGACRCSQICNCHAFVCGWVVRGSSSECLLGSPAVLVLLFDCCWAAAQTLGPGQVPTCLTSPWWHPAATHSSNRIATSTQQQRQQLPASMHC